jgi:hypothetical protein
VSKVAQSVPRRSQIEAKLNIYSVFKTLKIQKMIWYILKRTKNWTQKIVQWPGIEPGPGAVELSVGSLTRCPWCYEVIQKIPKKNRLIFYGQKPVTCSLWDSWLVATILSKLTASSSLHCQVSIYVQPAQARHFGRKTPDWLQIGTFFLQAGKLELRVSLYQMRREVIWFYLFWNNALLFSK